MPLYEMQPEDLDERINCRHCAQDRSRVFVEAPANAAALEKFRHGDGFCSSCWADAHKHDLVLVKGTDIGAYEGMSPS